MQVKQKMRESTLQEFCRLIKNLQTFVKTAEMKQGVNETNSKNRTHQIPIKYRLSCTNLAESADTHAVSSPEFQRTVTARTDNDDPVSSDTDLYLSYTLSVSRP